MRGRSFLEALDETSGNESRLHALSDALDFPEGAVAFYTFGAPREAAPPASAPRSTHVVCAPEARGWWTDYCGDRDRHARDPVRAAIVGGIAPVYWNAFVSGANFARSGDKLWQHLCDHRITAGVSIPLHDVASGRYGSFSVLQFGRDRNFSPWLAAHESLLCAAAFAFHLCVAGEAGTSPGIGLTPREAECLALVAEGLTSKQIARRLLLSPKTIDLHLSSACRRLGVANRAQAVARASSNRTLRLSLSK